MEYQELKAWRDDASSRLANEIERLQEQLQAMMSYQQVLNATDELFSKIDDLEEEVERQQREIDDLDSQLEQKTRQTEKLERELLEAKNLNLSAEITAKPMEIHNHFESGSNSQVFNDNVKGKISQKRNVNKEKKAKKRWKKIMRKML